MKNIDLYIWVFLSFFLLNSTSYADSALTALISEGRPAYVPNKVTCHSNGCSSVSSEINGSHAYSIHLMNLNIFHTYGHDGLKTYLEYTFKKNPNLVNDSAMLITLNNLVVEGIRGANDSAYRFAFYKIENEKKVFDYMMILNPSRSDYIKLVRCKNSVADIAKDDCTLDDREVPTDEIFYILSYHKHAGPEFLLKPGCDIMFDEKCMVYALNVVVQKYFKKNNLKPNL